MSRFQLNRVLFVLFGVAAVLVAVTVAQATPITFGGSYDGSYDPYGTPPAGQSTWRQGSATLVPVPNDDNGTTSPGVATFKDTSTTARLNMNRNYSDGNTFSGTQANDEYAYEARVKFYIAGASSSWNSSTAPSAAIGFRDEYNGSTSGKSVFLGWSAADSAYTGLRLLGSDMRPPTGVVVTNTDYFDNAWHTYRVEKYIDGEGITQVDVRVDTVLLGTFAYSSLPDSAATTEGFGWFGATPNTVNATVDYINYQGFVIPEPSALALLATGLIGLLCYAWRKRK